MTQGFMAGSRLRREVPLRNGAEGIFVPQEGFQDDKQLQAMFTQYCLNNGTSSYTVNDYCSRIKKTWKSFEEDYRAGKLAEEMGACFAEIPWDGDLLNAYDHIEALGQYIKAKIAETEGNRNWQNARAALNKLVDFKKTI